MYKSKIFDNLSYKTTNKLMNFRKIFIFFSIASVASTNNEVLFFLEPLGMNSLCSICLDLSFYVVSIFSTETEKRSPIRSKSVAQLLSARQLNLKTFLELSINVKQANYEKFLKRF